MNDAKVRIDSMSSHIDEIVDETGDPPSLFTGFYGFVATEFRWCSWYFLRILRSVMICLGFV